MYLCNTTLGTKILLTRALAGARLRSMDIGDRVVHIDSQWFEYVTVAAIHDLGSLGRYVFTADGPGDWEDLYVPYVPGGAEDYGSEEEQ